MPIAARAEAWQNASPPFSSVMKPYPFVELNHLTVPFADAIARGVESLFSRCAIFNGTFRAK